MFKCVDCKRKKSAILCSFILVFTQKIIFSVTVWKKNLCLWMKWLFWNSTPPKASNIQFTAWSIPLKVRIVPIFTSNIMLLLINAWSCCYLFLLYKWCWSYFEVEDIFEFEKYRIHTVVWYLKKASRKLTYCYFPFISIRYVMPLALQK